MKTSVYNKQNEVVGEIELLNELFGVKWNPTLVHQVVISEAGNKRRPWAHTKDRSEVRGGGKKPWRQKHTGRARAGSSRSPIWVGGGITFGPRNERLHERKINKKMRRGALCSVLSKKASDNEIKILNDLSFDSYKTKNVAGVLKSLFQDKAKVLVVGATGNKNLFQGGRNIVDAKIAAANSLNVSDCMKYKYIVFDEMSLKETEKNYAKKSQSV